jgi:Fe-S-cluster containining protein
MEYSSKIKSIGSHHPRHWFEAYLHQRASLAPFQSDFQCDAACTRPGCKNQDVLVPVSLIDLVGAARYRGESVAETFKNNYSLGLISNDRGEWLRLVTLRLQKPCPFLENDRCSIYPVRPLPCILFPEYLVPAGSFETTARKEMFKDYLCLQHALPLSPERVEVIAQLRSMLARESLTSSFYLFGRGACHVDFSKLLQELSQAAASQKGEPLVGQQPPRIIPNHVLEQFFLEHIATSPPFAGVRKKIFHLETQEGQRQFLHFFQDDLLIKHLKTSEDDRAFVFRSVRGKLQASRRSLPTPEVNFY